MPYSFRYLGALLSLSLLSSCYFNSAGHIVRAAASARHEYPYTSPSAWWLYPAAEQHGYYGNDVLRRAA